MLIWTRSNSPEAVIVLGHPLLEVLEDGAKILLGLDALGIRGELEDKAALMEITARLPAAARPFLQRGRQNDPL